MGKEGLGLGLGLRSLSLWDGPASALVESAMHSFGRERAQVQRQEDRRPSLLHVSLSTNDAEG